MTQVIERSETPIEIIMTPFSRYLNSIIIFYGDKRIVTLNTYLRREFIETGREKSMLITKGVEYRPDLVSFDVYGIPDVWWRILEANNMKDVFDFKVGVTIILPVDPLV